MTIQEETNAFIETRWTTKKTSDFFRTFFGDFLGLELYTKTTLICVLYALIFHGLHMYAILRLGTI